MITVYNLETGLPSLLHPIDAREQLALGIVSAVPIQPPEEKSAPTKEALVLRAVELGVGNASTLARWGAEKLSKAIADKEAEE